MRTAAIPLEEVTTADGGDESGTLLRTIAREEPAGIRETARLVDRDVRQVHRNLNELESLGLIDLKERGLAKRPTVWYDTIEVDLPLFGPDSGSDAANT